MNAAPTPESVLAGIPGWQGAKASPLDGGLSNRTWLVEHDGRRAVLKVDAEPRGAPFLSRRAEASVQSAAAGAGLANAVLFVDDCVLLTDYAEGKVWTRRDLASAANLTELGRTLRRLHGLPATGQVFDAAAAADVYLEIVRDGDEHMIRRCRDVISSAPTPGEVRFCHNDLVAENIISTPAIRFLDWEYACDNDPYFDLATLIAHHELDAVHAALLAEAYADGDAVDWPRLEQQIGIYDALHYLWLAARADARPGELERIAAKVRGEKVRGQ